MSKLHISAYTNTNAYISHLVRPESKNGVEGTNDDVDADEEQIDFN